MSDAAASPQYQVTARKWRPQQFEDVVAQAHVAATLRNAVTSGRIAHAYLFSGPRGVGKTTTARILAKALNCERRLPTGDPCDVCETCLEIKAGRFVDVFEIDGASNRGVDEIRNLREGVRYPPQRGRKKVYIIDEVHMLTKEAFNALLKTLEEPPPHVVFIFATTEPHKVLPTILSRCQRFDFRRISVDEIIGRLRTICEAEQIRIDEPSLVLIAKKGDGAMRDAQSVLDQVVAFCGFDIEVAAVTDALNLVDQDLFFAVTDLIRARDTAGGLLTVEAIVARGYDLQEFLLGLAEHLRNFLVAATLGKAELIEAAQIYRDRYLAEAVAFAEGDLLRQLHLVTACEAEIKRSAQPRLKLELLLLNLIGMERTVDLRSLLSQIEALRNGLPMEPSVVPSFAPLPTSVPAPRPSPPPAAAPRPVAAEPISGPEQPRELVREPARSSAGREPDAPLARADEPSLRPVARDVDGLSRRVAPPVDPDDSIGSLSRASASAATAESPVRRPARQPGQVSNQLHERVQAVRPAVELGSLLDGPTAVARHLDAQRAAPPVRVAPPTMPELRARWGDLSRQLRSERPGLASLLDQARPTSLTDRTVEVLCGSSFDAEQLTQSREVVSSAALAVFGHRLVCTFLAPDPSVESSGGSAGPARSERDPRERVRQLVQADPILRLLIDELGAEPIL